MSALIIGTGYVAGVLARRYGELGIAITQTSRRVDSQLVQIADGAQLDRLISATEFTQIIVCGQLTATDIDWVLERIDGVRWLIFSSQQVTSRITAPGTEAAHARETFALERGACVMRPTMIFGHGGDRNISRVARLMRKWHVGIVPGPGSQMIQPLYVDDLAHVVIAHHDTPIAGLFALGGLEAAPVREVVKTLAEILGVRLPLLTAPTSVPFLGRALRPIGLRADQLARLTESKTADNSAAVRAFRWQPEPLGIRLEQAAREC